MLSPFQISAFLLPLLALGAVEAAAWWWMNPPATDQPHPILTYRPSPLSPSSHSSVPQSSSSSLNTGNFQPITSPPSFSLLPDVVASALPSLRCTTGTAARIDHDDGTSIHIAFFGWDKADSTNVLEAYKHLPEECMGSIGMKLTEKRPPRPYRVGDETLWFDHTVFRDPTGVIVHAFKGTWVSGTNDLLSDAGLLDAGGPRGGAQRTRQLRWQFALQRYRPAHARVAQGAVRSIPNPDLAWAAFESAMLKDLVLVSAPSDQ